MTNEDLMLKTEDSPVTRPGFHLTPEGHVVGAGIEDFDVEFEGPEDERTAGVTEWLDREDVCAECGDLTRESMGLDPRPLEDVSGVGTHKAEALRRGGFRDVGDLREATQHDLSELPEIGNALAARIKADVGGYDQ